MSKSKTSNIDRKYLGDEPTVSKNSSASEIISAYNWFNYCYNQDEAKEFVIDYLRRIKFNKEIIKKISMVDAIKLMNMGWNCRLLSNGSELPIDIESKMWHKIHTLTSEIKPKVIADTSTVSNIQHHIDNKSSEIIAILDEQIDIISISGYVDFNITEYFRSIALKPAVAKQVIDYYKPLYGEIYDVINDTSPDLKYAYRMWKKKSLRVFLEFLTQIISSAELHTIKIVATRKPRKKKIKPAGQLVSKLKYQEHDTTYNIKSVKPHEIIGCSQLWLFNTKYRTLSVINALGNNGLTVKGSTVYSFDEKTSIVKKLRKPESVLTEVMSGGKISLRKVMDNIKCKPKIATGRINNDTILLRAIK